MTIAYWCAATGQPASSWHSLTYLEREAFLEVANEIAQIRAKAAKKRR